VVQWGPMVDQSGPTKTQEWFDGGLRCNDDGSVVVQ
jgi:hypothetical protein